MDEEIEKRTVKEIDTMNRVFKTIKINDDSNKTAVSFFDMASNYFKDSKFFLGKKDYIRAFEAVVISWAYVDAGIKCGFFSVPSDLNGYFTN